MHTIKTGFDFNLAFFFFCECEKYTLYYRDNGFQFASILTYIFQPSSLPTPIGERCEEF